MSKNSHRLVPRNSNGFTLLEIVIALAIVAIAMLALSQSINQSANVSNEVEKRLLASWLASNQIERVRYESRFNKTKAQRKSEQLEMGGHQWRVITQVEPADVDDMFILRAEVYDVDIQAKKPIATMQTALGKGR